MELGLIARVVLVVFPLTLFSGSSTAAGIPKTAGSKREASQFKRDASSTSPQDLDACGRLIAQYNNDGISQFPAKDAYNCLTAVPFNADVGRSFLDYVSGTLAFQSDLAYLRDPPPSYQQPAVDVLEALHAVGDNIDSGVYTNEYAFEADLQRIIYRMCDNHLNLEAGLLWTFTFGSPINIVSVSSNGVQFPQPYVSTDVIGSDGSFTPSPIQTINGQSAVDFLKRYAELNSGDGLELHADYNALMYTQVMDIQYYTPVFGSTSPFYTGDLLDIEFANGTSMPTMRFQATANFITDTTNVKNAQDLYNAFVTLPSPDATDDTDDSADTNDSSSDGSDSSDEAGDGTGDDTDDTVSSVFSYPTATATNDPSLTSTTAPTGSETDDSTGDVPDDDSDEDSDDITDPSLNNWNFVEGITAYPRPDVAQPNLGYGGWVSGYFLHGSRTGVLSIPSFDMNNEAVSSFSYAIGNFTQRAQETGMKRIVIDLQQNDGGDMLLAVDAFKHFFPSTDVYGGSRTRSTKEIDMLGYTLTQYFEPYLRNQSAFNTSATIGLIDDPWCVLNIVNPESGKYFTSWDEFKGPIASYGDLYTKMQQYNFSNPLFDSAAVTDSDDDTSEDDSDDESDGTTTDAGDPPPLQFIPYGYTPGFQPPSPPFAAEDIVILTDTACASTCAMFVELMHHVAGVKTITVGGLPQPGPIQAVGGTRGAQLYSNFDIDSDISVSAIINDTATALLPSNRDDLNFTVTQITINLKDQVRSNEDFPLQFEYAAADCRFFWTQASLNNFTELWSYAAAATWDNKSLCVADSTGYVQKETDKIGPDNEHKSYWNSGMTFAEGRAAAEAVYSNNSNSEDHDSSMAGFIMGGIGGQIEDLGGFTSGDNSGGDGGCTANSCGKNQDCRYSAACENGAYDVSRLNAKPQCKTYCKRHGTGCGSNFFCNFDSLSCAPNGKCFALRQDIGFCESLSTKRGAKTCNTQNALTKVGSEIVGKKLKFDTVLNRIASKNSKDPGEA
ncbi:MAG: hypothetical protein Q9162_007667 [Coniocarpon cinnabarinum]